MKENWLGIFGLMVAVVIAALYFTGNLNLGVQQAGVPYAPTTVSPGDVGCNVNPSVVPTVTDALQPGTSVTTVENYRLNGQFTGTTSPTTKGTADIMFDAGGYLNTTVYGVPIGCGSNLVTATIYAAAIPTVTVYKDNGISVLTNGATGGAVNESAAASGGQYNWKVHMVGTDKKSSGQMMFVVDLIAPNANITSVTLTPITGAPVATKLAAVPRGYSTQTSGGYSIAFLVPAIVGANTADYNLQAQANTGYFIRDSVYTTLYVLNPFVETDGSFNPGNTGWNSLGAAKYYTTSTYNWCINTAGTSATCD